MEYIYIGKIFGYMLEKSSDIEEEYVLMAAEKNRFASFEKRLKPFIFSEHLKPAQRELSRISVCNAAINNR